MLCMHVIYVMYVVYVCYQVFIQAILRSVTRHKSSILQLSFETQSSYIYISVCFWFCFFAYLLSCWNPFAVVILAIKIKRYLHVSYMQLFDYLRIHNIIYITYLDIQKMKILSFNTLGDITSV